MSHVSTDIQMVCLRNVPFIDADTLEVGDAREALFREQQGFLLYLSKDALSASREDRILWVGAREALLWLNEAERDRGSFRI